MKYVDEFRDGKLARDLGGAIARAADPARRYNFMEFCGGHTHAIARYGVTDLLPANVRMIHGPGCPVCVLPVGRVDMAIEIAQRPGVILATYGDTMRVPASGRLSLLKAKAQGADVRMVYSTQDAVRLAAEHPDREVVMFAIGFETTTPPTALAIKEAEALGLDNFLVFCNHVLTPSAISHILESPEVRDLGTVPIDGFVGPAHVSTIIGSRPYEFFAEEYQKPVVIAGFEPLDVMQAILMLVRQVNDGRCEVENEFTRAVNREGNLKAQALVAEVFELRRQFEWRGLGEVPYSALQLKDKYAALRRRAPLWTARSLGGGSQGLRVRRDPARRQAACRLQGVRHRLHAGESAGQLHGVLGGRLRRALHLRQVPRPEPARRRRGRRRQVKRGFTRALDFRHGQVDMTHGSGGRAMAQLVEELFVASFDNDALRAHGRPGAGRRAARADWSSPPTPTSSRRCSSRAATSAACRCTAPSTTSRWRAHSRCTCRPPSSSRKACRWPSCAASSSPWPRRRARRACPIVTGDTKVVERGNGDGVFITTTGVGVVPAGIEISGERARPGDVVLVNGFIGDHGVAIMSLRENLEFGTSIRSDTAALHGLVAAMLAAVPTLHCLRDPTRGGLATTLNELARQSGVGMLIDEQRIPVRDEVSAACEFLGLDPLYVANEGKLVAICPADAAPALLAAMRAHPLGRDAAIIGEVVEDEHAFVQMDTSFGGRRVVDWLTGDQLPRIC